MVALIGAPAIAPGVGIASVYTPRTPSTVSVTLFPARPPQLKLSRAPANHPRFLVFAPLASAVEGADTEALQEEKENFKKNVANKGGIDAEDVVDKEKKKTSVLMETLLSYNEGLKNGDQSTVAEIEAFLLSFESEKEILANKVASLTEELKVEKDRILRISADFDNYRKRTERDRLSLMTNVQGEVVESLLPVLDNFERAKTQIKLETEGEGKITSSYQSIYKQFVDILTSLEVETVETVGKPFDPLLHEAIIREESWEHAEGIIIQEFRKGFKISNRLVRASMVKVSAGPGPAKAQDREAFLASQESTTPKSKRVVSKSGQEGSS